MAGKSSIYCLAFCFWTWFKWRIPPTHHRACGLWLKLLFKGDEFPHNRYSSANATGSHSLVFSVVHFTIPDHSFCSCLHRLVYFTHFLINSSTGCYYYYCRRISSTGCYYFLPVTFTRFGWLSNRTPSLRSQRQQFCRFPQQS